MTITEVRIKLCEQNSERLLAFCSITFDNAFVVRDLKIIDGPRGVFVAMPSRKLTGRCHACQCKNHLRARFCNQCGQQLDEGRVIRDQDDRAHLHADIAHPIHSAARVAMEGAVIRSYHEEKERAKLPGYVCRYEDYDAGDYEDHAMSDVAMASEKKSRAVVGVNPEARTTVIPTVDTDIKVRSHTDSATATFGWEIEELPEVLSKKSDTAVSVFPPFDVFNTAETDVAQWSLPDRPINTRCVNVWRSEASAPMIVCKEHSVLVDIGPAREGAVGGGVFPEPSWGDRTTLDIVLALSGRNAHVTPAWQKASLPRIEAMPAVQFTVQPMTEGRLELRLSILMADELTLLEEYRLAFSVAPKAVAEAPR